MSAVKRRRILDIVRTDATFERAEFRGHEVWVGRCLHCNGTLMIGLDGEPQSRATIEHIVPKSAGGSNEAPNLGLACARCNAQKGKRHDPGYAKSERAQALVARLLERRQERWREPEPD
jgi:5-methylcytosine-specific restriction endonuclease McrA